MVMEGRYSRRQILTRMGRTALGAALFPTVFSAACGGGDEETGGGGAGELTYVAYGGEYGFALLEAFVRPFEHETGIKVNFDESGPSPAKIKAMVESGNVQWDVVDGEGSWLIRLSREDLLEELDYSTIDVAEIRADSVEPYRPYGVSKQDYSFVLGYNTDALSPEQVPGLESGETWKEFWDVDRFPGRRGLQPLILNGLLEFALLADGVSEEKLYPVDVDRAFASLDKIKPDIALWSQNQTQSSQVLVNQELDMCEVTSGRVPVLKREGAPVDQHYNQGCILPNPLFMPKGAPNKENAMRFIDFCLQAKNQANLSELIPYGPTNPKAFDLIDPKLAPLINSFPKNLQKQFRVSDDWWADNEDQMYEQFATWLGE
jgi:putative spermidine/putrescine transport system substrate-binding protein